MTYLMCLFLGFAMGHYMSPWLDHKQEEFLDWMFPERPDDWRPK